MTPKISDPSERSWESSDFQETREGQPLQKELSEGKCTETDKPAKKSVRFAPTAKVRQVPKWTKSLAQEVWFTAQDFHEMKKSFAPTVQLMMQGMAPEKDTEEHCLRGLEYRTKNGARQRMQNKVNGMAAVLHEQDRQGFENQHNPEVLAEVYRQATHHCFLEALALGRRDEKGVQAYVSCDNNETFYDVLEEQQQQQQQHQQHPQKKLSKGLEAPSSAGVPERGFRGSLKRFWSGSGRLMTRNSAGAAA